MSSPSVDKIEENYDDLIAQAKPLLYKKDFDSAYELLQKIPNSASQAGYANLLKALALLAGRSFNATRPIEREKVEKHLISAWRKGGNELIPLVLLAILEIDYYNYHGQASSNNVSPAEVAQNIKMKQLSEEDIRLLGLLKISRDARYKLGLNL
jgi:hypothetical protein